MVTNQNNSFINSFTKGMNSDTSFDQIENQQYIFGQNVRISKNQPIGTSGDYSSVHEGIVAPVPEGQYIDKFSDINTTQGYRILSVQSIDRIAIVIATNRRAAIGRGQNNTGSGLYVFKFTLNESTNELSQCKLIWCCDKVWQNGAPEKVSAVLYKELENVIKLYIATGEYPIISLRVDDQSENKYKEQQNNEWVYVSIDKLINNREIPTHRVYIDAVISGRLTTSQVQYTYRYYNKYGNTTQLAPLTNKIQIIDPSRTKEAGNAENTPTSMGLALKINVDGFKKPYEKLQVYRLSYITPGQDAEIDLIYDGDIKVDSNNYFNLNDIGIEPLQKLSIEEFSAMSGLILVPQIIEQNQEYMFCANVKDDTILKGVERVPAEQNEVEYEIISTKVLLSDKTQGDIPDTGNQSIEGEYNDIYRILSANNDVSLNLDTNINIRGYLQERDINPDIVKSSYNDIFTSSLLRSLRRGETYKYAIVFYDDKGRRTDVINLCDVEMFDYRQSKPFQLVNYQGRKRLVAVPCGVKLKIPKLKNLNGANIIGCQVIRRSSSDIYQKNLLQVALARPISQPLFDVNITSQDQLADNISKKSPFYPSGLLTVLDTCIYPTYYYNNDFETSVWESQQLGATTRNRKLYQIFSSEIDFRRDDVLSKINTSDSFIKEVAYVSSVFAKYNDSSNKVVFENSYPESMSVELIRVNDTINQPKLNINRKKVERLTTDAKQSKHWVYNFYFNPTYSRFNYGTSYNSEKDGYEINQIKDVKIPEWNSGFTEIQRIDSDQRILTAIKKYKSYSTNIDAYTYNNWVSFAKYDLKAGTESQANMDWNSNHTDEELLSDSDQYNKWFEENQTETYPRVGFIGPGPSCFLLTTKDETSYFSVYGNNNSICTSICNIKHNPRITDVESDDYIQYYGFGNWFNLKPKNDNNGEVKEFVTESGKDFLTVFDGDIYITPHELATMYKAYDFNSADTLQSTQVVNYVPLESKVNTYFDYGMNLRNTNSENLMYEPGYIDGVKTQDRPVHQYNMIYSDNDASNDLFTLITTDKDETNQFKQRAYYSDLKTNGEFIDNFLIFKTASFIDVDSRYGEITNMLTDKNNLYYWQDSACGKFSVNERSLVNDQNNNTIMLGQAGILSRYDYLSTKYGMRLHDFCARSVDSGGIFWVDINNKAVAAISGNGVVNYGEVTNVQNIINDRITDDVPHVDYDLQNNEVLCKCLDGDQIVFNIKYNIATSIYTRKYDDMLYIKNHIFGLAINDLGLHIRKYNYLQNINKYLSPVLLEFIVNPVASVTKVFDSQQLIPIKRGQFNWYEEKRPAELLKDTAFSFETDIIRKAFSSAMEPHTDREGNIVYNIPRYTEGKGYGNRIRGKWLRVNIKNTDPTELFTISHIITKFRQSYS